MTPGTNQHARPPRIGNASPVGDEHRHTGPHQSDRLRPLNIVACPDSFKGSLDAASVSEAMREGWCTARPQDRATFRLLPMADGGEGTRRAFNAARSDIRVVELAELCGIETLPELDPWNAGTVQFGKAIRAAVLDAARIGDDAEVYLGIGSSASTDCGVGMLQGLGFRFLDDNGEDIGPGLAGIARAVTMDSRGAEDVLAALRQITVKVITDVTAPLCGPGGAVRAFGPQKGLGETDFEQAETIMARCASLIQRGAPHRAVMDAPGAGAAGGVGFALLSLGAELVPGAREVAAALGLPDAVAEADVVLTGEGAFDATSLQGKVPATVVELCTTEQTPCVLLAGIIRPGAPTEQFVAVRSLEQVAGSVDAALADPQRWIREATLNLAASYRGT